MAGERPVCVSMINMKGGVGKTTIAALLCRYASALNLNVLAIDLDPQANLSQTFMGEVRYRQFIVPGGGVEVYIQCTDFIRISTICARPSQRN